MAPVALPMAAMAPPRLRLAAITEQAAPMVVALGRIQQVPVAPAAMAALPVMAAAAGVVSNRITEATASVDSPFAR